VRNVNMLIWHRRLWLIDHGASLYFHHAWSGRDLQATNPFALIKDHVLLKYAGALPEADVRLAPLITADKVAGIVELIPDSWLMEDPGFAGRDGQRRAYCDFFTERLQSSAAFVQEAIRARSSHL
jgi:hypothetical protein